MSRITIENVFKKTLKVADHSRSLLKHLQDNGIDWMHACGGKGRCTTCKVIVLEGKTNFQQLTSAEKRYRQEKALKDNERLACQAQIHGDVTIMVPPEYRLPHIKYSDEE